MEDSIMKSAVFIEPGKVEVQDVDMPKIEKDDDVILKVVRTCVCGSDLWSYRGLDEYKKTAYNNGHEALGVVETVGKDITTLQPGDFVIVPFTHGCGHCAACLAGYDGSCLNHADNFTQSAQAEYLRAQHGEWSLVKVPGKPEDYSDEMLDSLLALSDVMATGYHAARTADVQKGDTAVVIGDGAVGLCGVISAKLRGAKQIIAMSRHEDRQKLAMEFGATDIISERGDEAVKKVMELTHGNGADAVLECVGTELSTQTALDVARPGAKVGRVGLPHSGNLDIVTPFGKNIALAGGIASVTTYDRQELLDAVLSGAIHPGKVFTGKYKLEDINQAYKDMAERNTIKATVVND